MLVRPSIQAPVRRAAFQTGLAAEVMTVIGGVLQNLTKVMFTVEPHYCNDLGFSSPARHP